MVLYLYKGHFLSKCRLCILSAQAVTRPQLSVRHTWLVPHHVVITYNATDIVVCVIFTGLFVAMSINNPADCEVRSVLINAERYVKPYQSLCAPLKTGRGLLFSGGVLFRQRLSLILRHRCTNLTM